MYGGTVAACGLAGGHAMNTTVFPFILRGVSLLGIDSVYCPQPYRTEVWQRLSQDLPLEALRATMHEVPMSDLFSLSEKILQGKVKGRVVVDVNREEPNSK